MCLYHYNDFQLSNKIFYLNKFFVFMNNFKLNKYINSFNFFFILILTYIFFITSIFTDNLIFFNLIDRIQYKDRNFIDYLCYLTEISVYPLFLLEKIFGFKISYFFLTIFIGILFSYFTVKTYSQVFKNNVSINTYFIIFFFYMPFGIGGYYVDQLIYLLSILSLYFFFKDHRYNYVFSAFFLSIIMVVKLFHVAPFLISFTIIFFYKFLVEKDKYHVIKNAIIFNFSFLAIVIIFYSLYIHLNKIPINLFYEYQVKQSLFYSTSRFDEFIYRFFFLDFNLFNAISNKNFGIIIFYPFIIIFYISLFFLLKNINKVSYINRNIFLIFTTVSTSINFIIAGRDLNHKILFLPILFFVIMSLINLKFIYKLSKYFSLITTFVIIIYSLFPINERINIKDILNNEIAYKDNFFKFQNGKYKNFYYNHRSRFFAQNNVDNLPKQIKVINNFFVNEYNKKNNEYKFIFFDDESLPISSNLNKKNCSPVCANLYKNNPPEYALSNALYINNFKKFYEFENTLLIVCYIDRDKNKLCLKKPSSNNNDKGSIPGDFDRFRELQESINSSTEIFRTKNFSIYKYKK